MQSARLCSSSEGNVRPQVLLRLQILLLHLELVQYEAIFKSFSDQFIFWLHAKSSVGQYFHLHELVQLIAFSVVLRF